MRIVVTGASGYLGPRVVERLVNLGHEVIPVVRNQNSTEILKGHNVLVADILNKNFSISEFGDKTPDSIIHLAWQDGFEHDNPSHFENVSAHFNFVMNCALNGIKRISVLGTMHEVGYWEGAINADTPTNPISMYGIAKDSLRRALFRALPEGVSLQWLRAFYILGDDERNSSIFTKLLQAEDRGDAEFPFTTGKNKYDFISILDLADLIGFYSTSDALPIKSVINCSSGIPITLKDKVEEFILNRNLSIRLKYGVYPDRPYDSPAVWGHRD